MLSQNKSYLKKEYPAILEAYQKTKLASNIEIISAKDGNRIPQVSAANRKMTLHSKYDPIQEAERLMSKYANEIEDCDHILFFGLGFGYHVKMIMDRYSDKRFSIYEPDVNIFYHFLAEQKLTDFPLGNLKHLMLEWDKQAGSSCLQQFGQELYNKVLLITLPSYQRIYQESFDHFSAVFKQLIQTTKLNNRANILFSQRWTINSLMNLPTTLGTPNFMEHYQAVFKGKPIILVSAGPSLAEEYEHLKYIKANQSAYIVAVGSAIKGLLANGLHPDAVCTYDPQLHNYKVFEPLLEQDINSIPMIYGTTVGYETIQKYKGPKTHVVTSQDTVTPVFIKDVEAQSIIDDAPSVAVFTFDIFAKLQVGLIILVGQNLAFKENLYYAKDIKRGMLTSAEIQERDMEEAMEVEDVYGNKIQTHSVFNQMRLSLEHYIEKYQDIEVINTTKAGANIKGAPFIPLEEVVHSKLTPDVVEQHWFDSYSHHKKQLSLQEDITAISNEAKKFLSVSDDVQTLLLEIRQKINSASIGKRFTKLDKKINEMLKNTYFKLFLFPVLRVNYEILASQLQQYQLESDSGVRSQKTLESIEQYMQNVLAAHNHLDPIFNDNFQKMCGGEEEVLRNDCGVFLYEGPWEKGVCKTDVKSREAVVSYHYTTGETAKIHFRFKGTHLKVLAGKRRDFAENVQIHLNGEAYSFSTKDYKRTPAFVCDYNQTVYELNQLENKLYDVEIIVHDPKTFVFNGIEINKEARVYHIDEVTEISELRLGKRIRCHYQATFNKAGTLQHIGRSTSDFIPPESTENPNGDFYFIMVDEEKQLLIADRNIQRHISWINLEKAGVATEEGIEFKLSDGQAGKVRLMTGGHYEGDTENEWDRYLNELQLFSHYGNQEEWWNGGKKELTGRIGSWTLTRLEDNKAMRRNFEKKYVLTDLSSVDIASPNSGYRPLLEMRENERQHN